MESLVLLAQGGDEEVILGIGMICLIIFGLVVGIFVNFIPTMIAVLRGHQNIAAIFVLNLLLGWTFIGWAVALVWAFTANDNRR